MTRPIRSDAFAKALAAAGILGDLDAEPVRRVVIDAQAGCVLMLYVERFGDERLLNVALTLDGIEVQTGQPADGTLARDDDTARTGQPSPG